MTRPITKEGAACSNFDKCIEDMHDKSVDENVEGMHDKKLTSVDEKFNVLLGLVEVEVLDGFVVGVPRGTLMFFLERPPCA